MLGLGVASAGLSGGCTRDLVEAQRGEAARFVRFVEELREAPNDAKRAPLAALAAAECSAAPVCDLQATCVRGYSEHVGAYTDLARAKARVAGAAAVSSAPLPSPSAIAARLAAAQIDVKACADAEGAIRRVYGL